MNKIICLCFLLLGTCSQITSVFAQTQLAINKEACDELGKIDADLYHSYQDVLVQYKDNKIFLAKFINAQRKWLAFRDAYFESIFPNEQPNFYGSIYPMCRCSVLANITNERLKQIKKWINGIEEGDVCGGSIKVRTR